MADPGGSGGSDGGGSEVGGRGGGHGGDPSAGVCGGSAGGGGAWSAASSGKRPRAFRVIGHYNIFIGGLGGPSAGPRFKQIIIVFNKEHNSETPPLVMLAMRFKQI